MTEPYDDTDRWVLTVEFANPPVPDYFYDGGLSYPERLAQDVMAQWEHDEEASTLARGIGFNGDLRWEVTDDTRFTAYSDIVALADLMNHAVMNTVPRKLTLELRE